MLAAWAIHHLLSPTPSDMTDPDKLFTISPAESERLGSPVHRVELPFGIEMPDIIHLIQAARNKGSLTILRCDVRNFATWRALIDAGVGLFDVLEEYRGPSESVITSSNKMPHTSIVATRHLDPATLMKCNELCTEVFHSMVNHYSLDPLIPEDWSLRGYEDWFRRLSRPDSDQSGVWVHLHESEVAGFLAWRITEENCMDVALYGTKSSCRNRGIATELIAFATRHTFPDSISTGTVCLSTQTWNLASKHTALRVGLKPYRTLLTFHLWS
jgi:hypothetical protein